MKDLKVTPAYLSTLATKQRRAAEDIDDATNETTTTSFVGDIERTHGLYVRAGVNGISNAAGKREYAGKAMKSLAEALAQQLEEIRVTYARTDQQASQDINTQMQDG